MTSDYVRITLESTYTPEDYFEKPIIQEHDEYQFSIANGKIGISLKNPKLPLTEVEQNNVKTKIKIKFEAKQVFKKTQFNISPYQTIESHPDGRRDMKIRVGSVVAVGSVGKLDYKITDKDGNITHDTKHVKSLFEKDFSERLEKHYNDPIVKKMITSYGKSIENRRNTLVHLYEIAEALDNHFNGHHPAKIALGINNDDWREIQKLTCNEPIEGARHNGRHKGPLRPLTETEFEDVTEKCKNFIYKYLVYLK
jgi:hypothetical protein